MALADYRLCDVCGGKVFYDANLNYEQGQVDWCNEPIDETNSVKYCGELSIGTKLDYLGDWAVICRDCAETHRCIVVPIEEVGAGTTATEGHNTITQGRGHSERPTGAEGSTP